MTKCKGNFTSARRGNEVFLSRSSEVPFTLYFLILNGMTNEMNECKATRSLLKKLWQVLTQSIIILYAGEMGF